MFSRSTILIVWWASRLNLPICPSKLSCCMLYDFHLQTWFLICKGEMGWIKVLEDLRNLIQFYGEQNAIWNLNNSKLKKLLSVLPFPTFLVIIKWDSCCNSLFLMHLLAALKILPLHWFIWFSGLEIWKWACLLKVLPAVAVAAWGVLEQGATMEAPWKSSSAKMIGQNSKAWFPYTEALLPQASSSDCHPLIHCNC